MLVVDRAEFEQAREALAAERGELLLGKHVGSGAIVYTLTVLDLDLDLDDHEHRIWRGKRGAMCYVKLPPSVALLSFEGRITDDAIGSWNENFSWMLGAADTVVFFDCGELSYASARVTANGISLISGARKRVAAMHILVANALIEAMAEAANVTFGGFMQLHRTRAAFKEQFQRALESQHGAPSGED